MVSGSRRESGQAAVEAALTLPLVIFMILGALQLFMLLQARIMAQVAVYRAVRAGSLNQGDCLAMTHSALANLTPTLPGVGTGPPEDVFVESFEQHQDNRYNSGPRHRIIELVRERPRRREIGGEEDFDFDQPGQPMRLEARMLYWYRMRIPFANWVMSRMFLAHFGLQNFNQFNPLMPAEKSAGWTDGGGALPPGFWPGGNIGSSMRSWVNGGNYVFPITVNFGMRMMTPARRANFRAPACPL